VKPELYKNLLTALLIGPLTALAAADVDIFIGTYTTKDSQGLYRTQLDLHTGALAAPVLVAKLKNPAFLAAHPHQGWLYAVSETSRFAGQPGGGVTALARDAQTGALTELNCVATGGATSCHVAVDATGTRLVVANYTDGSAALFPIAADGQVGARRQHIKFSGSGPNQRRQQSPHAHGVVFDPANRFALITDLGTDRIMLYRLGATLLPNEPPFVGAPPGAGPRHAVFAPDGRHFFVINELHSTVTVYAWDTTRGVPTPGQTISTLPPNGAPENTGAEIAVHPAGCFVYASNRGHDSIAVFAFDAATARLKLVQHQPTGGRTPRHFALDPSGRWLLVANQDSDSIVVFRVDAATGRLLSTGHTIHVPTPVCLLPLPR
jgi:6-phosphogluconolactonase